ncbi:protein nessun dorma [Harpegnathos saltator]|uniref:SHC SH2 domain-binding protein 1-like protein B n=1 Tax=Harpegnathos saltator TaxID=610380 RepID=E2C3T7_HARSA|nr:protein nessun dorma [Harpegnathos saltator]EFN77323.1 SHC SH2 domain-binding protein 1-like protein B [Harpegnathos saltator]
MITYCFDKSLHERLTEYTDILTSPEKILPASQVMLEWVCDTEIVIEPVGWQALWNVPLSVCAENQVHYPLVVLVEVLQVDCSILSALVKVTWDELDRYLTFPTECKAKLIELYPTIKQTNTTLDIVGTAHCIDKLRFFYTYLWMPWDNEEDDNVDWVSQHLERRIKFAYDMRQGSIDKQTCDLIRSLVREGRQIWDKISNLEGQLTDDEDKTQTADTTFELMHLHFRLQQIKSEMDVLENPTMREMVLKHQSSIDKDTTNKNEITCYFVWLNGTLKGLQETCDKVQELLPNDLSIKIYGCLDEALHTCKTGDMIILGEGKHKIDGAGGLETGGTIRGIYDARHTILHPKDLNSASTLLDFSDSSTEVLLNNICINLGELPIGIIVRSGVVRIKHCIISNLSSKEKTVQTGIVVMPDGRLIMEDTLLEFLGTAVLICAHGEVVMNNCQIRSCYVGVQLSDHSSLTANKCVFDGCREYTIQMDTEKHVSDETKYLHYNELPNNISEITLNECHCVQSDFEDIVLKPKRIVSLAEWLDVDPKM